MKGWERVQCSCLWTDFGTFWVDIEWYCCSCFNNSKDFKSRSGWYRPVMYLCNLMDIETLVHAEDHGHIFDFDCQHIFWNNVWNCWCVTEWLTVLTDYFMFGKTYRFAPSRKAQHQDVQRVRVPSFGCFGRTSQKTSDINSVSKMARWWVPRVTGSACVWDWYRWWWWRRWRVVLTVRMMLTLFHCYMSKLNKDSLMWQK